MKQVQGRSKAPVIILLDALHSVAAGSERQIYQLIKGLTDEQVPVKLVLLRHTPFSASLSNFPCPVECLNISKLLSIQCVRAMLAFRRRLKAEGCYCVHAWLPESCLLAPLFLKAQSRRIITSRRDIGLIYQGKPAWLYRLVRRRTDCVIGNSQAVVEHARRQEKLLPEQLRVIHNGIESVSPACRTEPQPLFHKDHSLKIIQVANIKPIKRQLDAVHVCLSLNAQGVSCELALVGEAQDRSYQQAILDLLHQHPHGENVYLPGSIAEPRQLLTQAHIGLLISESEGLSNTLMEYMSAGLPTIATDTGGNPELIEHGVSGFLVPVGDQPALLQAIKSLADDPTQREMYGHKARDILLSKFSQHRMVRLHMQEYAMPECKQQAATC